MPAIGRRPALPAQNRILTPRRTTIEAAAGRPSMYALPASPLPVGGVIDNGFKLFRVAFAKTWFLALLQGVVGSIGGFMQAFATRSNSGVVPGFGELAGFVLISLAAGLVSVGIYAAMIVRMNSIATGSETGSVGDALATGFRKLPRMAVAGICYFLAIAAGLVLLVIPGLYVAVALSLFMAFIAIDDSPLLASLQRSYQYVKGHFWRVSAVLTVSFIIFIVIFAGLAAVVMVPVAIITSDIALVLILQQVIGIAVNIVAIPIMLAIYLVLFYDLKLRKDGSDLAARLDDAA